MSSTVKHTGSVERLAELLSERSSAQHRLDVAQEKLMNFLKRIELTKETHLVLVHHIVNTEERVLSDEEFRIVYGDEEFRKYRAKT